MNNIVFKSTTQFLRFVNERILEKERLFGSKNPNYAFEYIYNEQRRIPVSFNV